MKSNKFKDANSKFVGHDGYCIPKIIENAYSKNGGDYDIIANVPISKPQAQFLLDNSIPNRDLDIKRNVNKMKNDMNDGSWCTKVGDTICMNPKKKLNDGQNRLVAFLESDLDTLVFSVAINVEDKDIIFKKDKGKKRTPKERISMLVRNDQDRDYDLHAMETAIMTQSFVYSPMGKINCIEKLTAEIADTLVYKNNSNNNALRKTIDIYDSLNLHKRDKKCEQFWGCVFRSFDYFGREGRSEDLVRYCIMTFNSLANTKESYDGWAKLTKMAIDAMSRNRAKGSSTIKSGFYATINEYMYNYFMKIPLKEEDYSRSRRITVRKEEHFKFAHEMYSKEDVTVKAYCSKVKMSCSNKTDIKEEV